MPLPYRSVKDLYDTLHDSGAVQSSLPDWSTEMNRITESDLYNAGLHDNFIKQGSVGLDRMLEATGLPTLASQAGREVGGWVGAPDTGESIGHSLPRTAVNFAPSAFGIPGRIGTGVLSGAETYTETGSPAAGVLSGLTNALMPSVAGKAEQFALRKLGGQALSEPISALLGKGTGIGADQFFPRTISQGVVSQLAGQGAAAIFGEASGFGQDLLAGRDLHNPFSVDTLLGLTLGQAPFAAMHLATHGLKSFGGEATRNYVNELAQNQANHITKLEAADAIRRAKEENPLGSVPDFVPTETNPKAVAENSFLLGKLQGKQAELLKEATPQSMDEWNKNSEEVNRLLAEQQGQIGGKGTVGGETLDPTSERFNIVGTEHFSKPANSETGYPGYKIVKVADDPANIDQGYQAGDLIGYSMLHEPPPSADPLRPDTQVHSIPTRFSSKVTDKNAEVLQQIQAEKQAINPDLPPQTVPLNLVEYRKQQSRLSDLQKQLDSVSNDTDLRKVIVDYNNARLEAGYPALDDAAIENLRSTFEMKDVPAAVRASMARLQKRIARKQAEQDKADALINPLFQARQDAIANGGEIAPGTEEAVALGNDLHAVLTTSGLSSDHFNRLAAKWDENGRQGGVQGLVDSINSAKKSGRGKRKEDIGDKVTNAVADPTPEVQPILDQRTEMAEAIGHKIIDLEPEKASDVANWIDWVESGTKELPKWAGTKPYVQDWNTQLGRYLDMAAKNSLPKPEARIFDEGTDSDWSPYKPQTESEKQILAQWNLVKGGAGLAERLARSIYPDTAALGKAFLQFPEALKRVTSEMWNMPGSSFAGHTKDGRTMVVLDSALLKTDPDEMERVVSHELLHGLTLAELQNPTKQGIVDNLTSLRENLITSLPTKGGDASVKAAYDRAVKDGWMDKWLAGTTTPEELHADPRTRMILYGLLDNKEFITQGFTSESMRKWLQGQKIDKGVTYWHKFAGWVKELLGLGENAIDQSAFDALMSHTSQLLQQGEFVSSARNYLDRFFGNKGYEQEAVKQQTNRALGLILGSKGKSVESLVGELLSGESPSSELKAREQQVNQMFAAQDAQSQHANSILSELGLPAELAGLHTLATSAAAGEHTNLSRLLEVLPETASKFLFEKWSDAKDVLDGVKGAVAKKNQGLINLGDIDSLRGPVTEASKRLAMLTALQQEHQEAKVQIAGLQGINPQGLLAKTLTGTAKSLDDIKRMVDPDSDSKKFSNFIERNLSLPYQLARQDPRAAELVSLVNQRGANARKMKTESMKVFATDDVANTLAQANEHGVTLDSAQIGGSLTKESLQRSTNVVQNAKLTNAANAWIFENQKRNPGKETVLPDNDPEVAKILSNLTPDERGQVNEILQKTQVSKARHDAQIVEKMQQVSATGGVKLLGRIGREFGLALPANSRLAMASNLIEAGLTNFNDPQAAAVAQSKIQQVGTKLPIEVFNELIKYTQNEVEKIKLIQGDMIQRPGWVSGKDYGRFRVVYLDRNQQPHRWSGDSENEARQVAKTASKVVDFRDQQEVDQSQVHYPSMTPELIDRIHQLEENSWDMQGLSPEEKDQARKSFSVATQVEREAGAQGVGGVQAPARGLKQGSEGLPWLKNHFSWVTSSATGWTNKLLKAQVDTHLAEPEVNQSGQYKQWAKDYFEGYMAKDPELATNLKRFTSLWFLGGNMASALANPIGNGMRMISELTALSGKPLDSYSRFLKAGAEVAGNFKGNKPWATPEHEQLMKEATHEGRLTPQLYDEDAAAQEAVSTNFKSLIEGQKQQKLGTKLGKLAGVFSQAAMMPFRIGETWNAQVALLSAFDLYREQGLSYQEAKAKAFEFHGAVNDSGGRANRPVGPFSATGEIPRSAALLATAMQNYVLGSTFQLVRYLKSGGFRPTGLTPHEVWSSRKAAVQMLSMQFAAAGALGMPFVSGALSLLDKEFPDLELNRKLRENVKEFFQGDQASGNTLSDIAMTGVPSMFGWDLQSRLSMGNTLPGVSEVNGFQPEQLLGPPVGLLTQFVRGGQKLVSGQGSVSDWTPSSVKKLVQLVASGGDSVNDYKGRPVLNDLTPGEKVGIGLGFQPKRLSDFNAASKIASQQQRVAAQAEGQWRQQQAEEALKGNFGTVRQTLLERGQSDKSFDPVASVRAIAQAAEGVTFPRDLRREGNAANSPALRQLFGSFSLDPSNASEVSRLQFRQQIEQRLGLSSLNQNDLIKAKLMDQLRLQHPDATRSELARTAEIALRQARPRTLSLPSE